MIWAPSIDPDSAYALAYDRRHAQVGVRQTWRHKEIIVVDDGRVIRAVAEAFAVAVFGLSRRRTKALRPRNKAFVEQRLHPVARCRRPAWPG